MHRFVSSFCLIFVIIAVFSSSVSGRPTDKLVRHKRQSDQRLAELETLLGLQKYRHHRLHKGSQPGFGVIDFNTIGRRKKSTRFSPGEPNNVGHDFGLDRAATKLDEEVQPPSLADIDGPLFNEEIGNLVHYQSLILGNQDKEKDSKVAPHRFDFSGEEKK